MNKKKLIIQLIAIAYFAALFVFVNIFIYQSITRIYVNNYSEGMREKSIDIESYLPFSEDSLIVKVDSETKITEDIPVLDGATALYPVYSAFANALYPESSLGYQNGDFTEDSKIQKTGTTTAYKRVVDGTSDVVFCAAPSKKQLAFAEEAGVTLEMVPIGVECFVFIVNSKNPVDNISISDLKEIYKGNITNWKEVGGDNSKIIPLQRAEGSGSQSAMLRFMGDEPLMEASTALFGKRIGYSFRYYVESVVSDGNLKMLSLDGIAPTKENIRNGSYPISNNFYMVYRSDNTNPNIQVLKDYILSEAGQKIIEDTGYVGLI